MSLNDHQWKNLIQIDSINRVIHLLQIVDKAINQWIKLNLA